MRYTILLILSLMLTGCNEARQLNPGAATAYWEVPQSELDIDHQPHGAFDGVYFYATMVTGDCRRDGTRIRIAQKTAPCVAPHECGHLIQHFLDIGMSPYDATMAADRSLFITTDRLGWAIEIPAEVSMYFVNCFTYIRLHKDHPKPMWQWQVLQNMFPHDAVIQHEDILSILRAQESP